MNQGMIMNRYLQLTFALLLTFAGVSASYAQALMVNPKRVVFDDSKRNDVLTLFNSGNDTATYAIGFKHYQMLENGEFASQDSSIYDSLYADKMIRFFPREVTLAPKESQTVRVQVLKPKELAAGEYRTHLYFRGVDRSKALEAVKNDTAKSISLQLKAIFGLAVPLIIRNQTSPSSVSISDIGLSPKDTANMVTVSATLNRKGNESVYGTIVCIFKDATGKETELGIMKGLAVYVPLDHRKIQVRFPAPADIDLKNGTLRVEYQSLTNGESEQVLASGELPVSR